MREQYSEDLAPDGNVRRTHENVLWLLLQQEGRSDACYALATSMHALGWGLSHAILSVSCNRCVNAHASSSALR